MQKGDLKEKIYIIKRSITAFIQGVIYYIYRVFPIDMEKIVMWTFEGSGGYCCNPKYVAEEILRRNKEGEGNYKIIWLLNDMGKEFPVEIQKVKNTLWRRAYHLSTAGTWVSNTRTFYGTKKRRKQCYIQTWHSTIWIKPIGKYRGSLLPQMAYLVSKYDSQLIDYVLSGSAWCDRMYRDGLIYDGEIIRTGTPRCDVLLNQREEKYWQLRQDYQLSENARIILYAPTFRGGSQNKQRSVNMKEETIDFVRLVEALEKRFEGTWYVFLRVHPQLAAKMEGIRVKQLFSRLIDVSQRPDMNEIISGVDAFLTDYSSAIYEGAIIDLPGFIYADDLPEYIADRGKLVFDMRKLPFPVAFNNDELIKNILCFNEKKYRNDVSQFMDEVGMEEDGEASRRVVDIIVNKSKSC